MRRFSLALVFGGLCSMGTVALAADVAVLDLRFNEAPPAVKKQAERWLEASLRGAGYEVLAHHEMRKRLSNASIPPGCSFGPCVVRVGETLKVRRLVVGGIAVHGSSYEILLALIDAESGSPMAQVKTSCDICNFSDVGESVARAAKELHTRAQRFEGSRARLVLKEPARASVFLDGVGVGRTPLSVFVTPGRHLVELRGAGEPWKREVICKAGERVVIDKKNALAATASSVAPGKTTSSWPAGASWISWATLASGGALILAGGITLALDEGCSAGSCAGRRETRAGGLGLMAGGAVLTAAAGLLFWHATRGARELAASRPGLYFAGDGNGLGLTYVGSF